MRSFSLAEFLHFLHGQVHLRRCDFYGGFFRAPAEMEKQ